MAQEAEHGERAPFPNSSQKAKLGYGEAEETRQMGRPIQEAGSGLPGRGLLLVSHAGEDTSPQWSLLVPEGWRTSEKDSTNPLGWKPLP